MLNYKDFLEAIRNTSQLEVCNQYPMPNALEMLQGKWKNHILFELSRHDSIRFGELGKALPEITNTMLTSTLRELETYGLINRVQYNEIPPHVEYSLTAKGKDLMPIYYELYKWATKYLV